MFTDKMLYKFCVVLDIRRNFETLPDELIKFFKCGLVLYRRTCYDKGEHTDNIFDCEIEYKDIPDTRLVKNYEEFYKIIILKYGQWT